jgi:hypothetical protein
MRETNSNISWDWLWSGGSPLTLLLFLWFIWMLIDAIKREEWLWVVFLVLFPPLNTVLYFFLVYLRSGGGAVLSLPGSADRRRIRELEVKIRHLDNAHHYHELADLYFKQGRFAEAEKNYRAALDREPDDEETEAHLGRTLMALDRPGEARGYLENVCMSNPRHDYGDTLIALGECLTRLGEDASARRIWEQAIEHHSYAQPRIRLAELLLKTEDGAERERARGLIEEVLREDGLSPDYQRRQESEWVRRAQRLGRDYK